jgi:hypothetical protein
MTKMQQIEQIRKDFHNWAITREEAIRRICALGGITKAGAEEILDR